MLALLPDITNIAPYPPSNYGFDANGTLGRFDPIYIFASLLWNFCTFIVQVSLAFFQWGIQGTALNGLLDAVLSVIHLGVKTLEPVAFVLAIFVLAGMWVWDLLRKRPTAMWARFVKMFVALLAIWIYGHVNATFVNTLNNVTDETAASLGNVVLSLTHQGETVSSASTTLEQQIWSSLIQLPWEQGEMGGDLSIRSDDLSSVEACATSGVDWTKVQATNKWADALLQLPVGNQGRNCMAGILNSSKYPTAQQAFSSGNRLSVTLAVGFNLLGPVLFLLVFGILAMIARAGFLITLMLGVFVLPVELFPVTRTYGRTFRWALTALAGLVGTAVIDLYVAIVIVVGDVFQNAIQGAPLFLSMLWINVLYFAAIFVFFWLLRRANLRKRIRETVEKVGQRMPDRVPVGLGESIQVTKPAVTQALRRSRVSAAQRMRTVGGSGQSDGGGQGNGSTFGNFDRSRNESSRESASGGTASSFNESPSGNFGSSDTSGRDPSEPAAAVSLIHLSDLDTNRRRRKMSTVDPSSEDGVHENGSNPSVRDTFDRQKGRLPKRALMTDQTRRVPLTSKLKATAAEAAAVLGATASAKGATQALPKFRKATGVVLRKDTRRVPVPESLRTRVLERTADLRQRLAERRGQTALRVRRAKGVTWHEDVRRVPLPEKLRTRADGVKLKIAQSAASVPVNGRRVPATGVAGTLARRRVPLPEHLKARRDEIRARMADSGDASAFTEAIGSPHRGQTRSNTVQEAVNETNVASRLAQPTHAKAVPNGMADREPSHVSIPTSRLVMGGQTEVSARPVSRALVSTQRVRRALGAAGQTAFQTFAMGAGMSEKTEQKIRGTVSQAARALQASVKRVQRAASTTTTASTNAPRHAEDKTKAETPNHVTSQTVKIAQANPQTNPTNDISRASAASAGTISRPKVKPMEKVEKTGVGSGNKAVNESNLSDRPAPTHEKTTSNASFSPKTKSQTAPKTVTEGTGEKVSQASQSSRSLERPSVRRDRPRIRPTESERDTRDTSATTPPSTAQPIVKRALTTKRTPPKS
ncbi:hypothetical protein [Alicyclobacillus sendaiensis]|uniref:Uncharacterized protein n=1 Tax=Alicyclobacillus sendaiensis PA2 TaxID=3029425 RepID=A0ABT6Y167_ALISE|nr:hypothetical protein [Alicyclobacillus sendaiensis]MDI9261057.1 hypothetical protein [Alicyclobacillus sendaiensis PA2]